MEAKILNPGDKIVFDATLDGERVIVQTVKVHRKLQRPTWAEFWHAVVCWKCRRLWLRDLNNYLRGR